MKLLQLLLLTCILSTGCAMNNRNHLSTTNWVDRTIVPENKVAQWVMTPVWIPICFVTFTIDNVIICPIVSLPSAYEDTESFLNAYDEVSNLSEGDLYAEWGFYPAKVVFSPLVFIGDWIGRGLFAVDPRADALWGWPQWGYQWKRNEEGQLITPMEGSAVYIIPSNSKSVTEIEGVEP